jgi:8-oxo-dGTP pyrophosphatase MutT (NUDIX family)
MGLQNHAYFQVATKLMLKKDGKILALITNDDYLDFPGGRIDETEVDLPLESALARETEEELGPNLKFKVEKPIFITKRHYTKNGQNFRIVAVYYEAQYLSGDIKLSDEHAVFEWVEPSKLLGEAHKFISDDEEVQLKNYFSKI